MRWRVIALAVLVPLLWACGPPVVKTSDQKSLLQSIEDIKNHLEPDRQARFDDAFSYLTGGALLAGDETTMAETLKAAKAVEGMTGEEIIHKAWTDRIAEFTGKLSDLEAQRKASVKPRGILDLLVVLDARLYPQSQGFMAQPVTQLTLSNSTGQRIYNVTFEVSLSRRTDLDPEVLEIVERPFGGGLAPEEKVTVRVPLDPETWAVASHMPSGLEFACDVVGLSGQRDRTIADTDYDRFDERHRKWCEKRLEELRAEGP